MNKSSKVLKYYELYTLSISYKLTTIYRHIYNKVSLIEILAVIEFVLKPKSVAFSRIFVLKSRSIAVVRLKLHHVALNPFTFKKN